MKSLTLYKSNFFYKSIWFTVIIKTNLLKISPIWSCLTNYSPKFRRISTIRDSKSLSNKWKNHKIISEILLAISSMPNTISIKYKIFFHNKVSKALWIFRKKSSKMLLKSFLQMEKITTVCPKFSDFSSFNILFLKEIIFSF